MVETLDAEVTEADIDTMIERLREQRKAFVVEEDVWRRTVTRSPSTLPLPWRGALRGRRRGRQIVIGSGRMIPGFEEGLLGLKDGDEKRLEVTSPRTTVTKPWGQAAVFEIKAKAVAKAEMPERRSSSRNLVWRMASSSSGWKCGQTWSVSFVTPFVRE